MVTNRKIFNFLFLVTLAAGALLSGALPRKLLRLSFLPPKRSTRR